MARRANNPGKGRPIARLWVQAAHDLRQPVQAALLLTNMLEDISERTELTRAARDIGSALQSLYEMLEVLIMLARMEAGSQSVQLRTCRVADDLEPAVRELAEIAARRGILLRIRGLRGVVRSHPKLLVAAGRSLILNAIRLGNGREILFDFRRRSDRLSLEVHFSGASLDVDSNKLAFVQLPPQGDRPSVGELGLGLSLLKHLCGRFGHGLQHTALGADRQLLALMFPLPAAPG